MKNTFLFVLCLLVAACQKSGDNPPDEQNEVREKLTAGLWHQSEYWTDDDHDGVFTAHHPELCITDDTWLFRTNGELVVDDGNETCDTGLPPLVLTVAWELIENDTQIKITFDFDPDNPIALMIDSLTETELRAHTLYLTSPGTPTDEKFVFTH